ncbi:MAG: signal peptidase I [Rhodospirillaceae bacterium]|uniref:Signal peptidase I n=1 Tax=Candidatus Moanibacter tarae TaxID=2200854 RepID=A0A2Z4AHF2_9BACT|nr:MAG: Signal peptidase I [Candidatus Moanabacter tarae]MBH66960.1 signal peptidase I [Rhodospirillaceae bacterium]|tara:strand:- start:12994 stop:14289 length:1296 start_codon:yes stop_codon:yes gene_type:complete
MFRKSQKERRLFNQSTNLLRIAERVHDYRRDLMTQEEIESLRGGVERLNEAVRTRSSEKTVPALQFLEKHLRKSGGCLYPRTSWAENVEMLLVASILAIGIRTFFIQPFKIPTNSMYPSFNGLTYKISAEKREPSFPLRMFRMFSYGANQHKFVAPDDGEILVPIFSASKTNAIKSIFPTVKTSARKWLLLPTTLKEATIYVGVTPVRIKMPLEFNFDKVLRERFFPDAPETTNPDAFERWLRIKVQQREIVRRKDLILLKTGEEVKNGNTFLSFDILTGDALFVDRFSYNFIPPKVGDPIVFRTRKINGITEQNNGIPIDKYYIKRLVGIGGDTLAIDDGILYRNGKPIEGAVPFNLNANKTGEYHGYTNRKRLPIGGMDSVPMDNFYAMGDNSDESSDSRIWGSVPNTAVVGKALFIYYPFSKRWGAEL